MSVEYNDNHGFCAFFQVLKCKTAKTHKCLLLIHSQGGSTFWIDVSDEWTTDDQGNRKFYAPAWLTDPLNRVKQLPDIGSNSDTISYFRKSYPEFSPRLHMEEVLPYRSKVEALGEFKG